MKKNQWFLLSLAYLLLYSSCQVNENKIKRNYRFKNLNNKKNHSIYIIIIKKRNIEQY